ncbi:MAG: beta-phosphoglucomutase [Oscillospiraceae bacterium]|nr:beta-phosphoglucomutase [Oscillospiraceae bacterium]
MKYEGVIFDLDGVICFTDHYHYMAWKALADEIGAKFDESNGDRIRGVSRMESLEIVLEGYNGPAFSQEEKVAMATKKNDLYRSFLQTMTTADLSDEVRDTLNALRAKGLKLAIGSSSKNTPLILERIGLACFFDAVSDGNNITRSKPDPQVFLMAADMLKLDPKNCLVVEDAEAGIQAAISGGFDSAALGPAALCGKATHDMKSFSDLLKIV